MNCQQTVANSYQYNEILDDFYFLPKSIAWTGEKYSYFIVEKCDNHYLSNDQGQHQQ